MSAVRELFDALCDLPPEAREAALAASPAAPDIVARVRTLLAAELESRTTIAFGHWARHCGEAIAPAMSVAGAQLGAWRLLREIGHGGMGRVYLAERADGHYQQRAAVKLILEWSDPDLAAHFQRERQMLANLQHPQIARLLDGGQTPSGVPYLVMDYIDGVPLGEWCAAWASSLETRLALFASICQVVQYAHRNRVVHCDLKPSNVLVRADGVPVLLDFGIALALEPLGRATADAPSPWPLTPRYASPEQLRGETPGFASDIHALGLILRDMTLAEDDARARPGRRITREIEAIVACACAAEPAQRYASAAALADDVLRIGRHQPLAARAPSWRYVGAKLLRRRWPVFAATALMLAIATGFGWRLVLAERAARREAATADQAVDFLVSVFAASDNNQNPMPRKEPTARDLLDNGAERLRSELLDQPAVRARLLEALGQAYRHMGHNELAAGQLREAADLYQSAGVTDPTSAARSLEALTNTMANGDFPAEVVERTAQESLDLARRVHPAVSQPIANALMVQSLALRRGGHHDAALAAAEASLTINRHQFPGHRLGPAFGNLAIIKTSIGDYESGYADNESAAALSAPDSISQFYRHLTRGGLEERMGRCDESVATLRRAIAIEAGFRDESSAMAIWARTLLGRTLSSCGRHADAKAELDRAVADQIALGEDPKELLLIRTELARNQLLSGDADAALATFRTVAQAREASHGAGDPRTIVARVNVAEALLESGQADASTRETLAAAWHSWQALGQTHVSAALRVRALQARWELEHGDPALAAAWLAEVATWRERLPFRERPDLDVLQARVASALGERQRAFERARAALAAYRALLGDANPATQAAERLVGHLAEPT